MFFSIVIPTYNATCSITRCLESCVAQTYSDFEIIIVDDASNDDTVLIVEHVLRNSCLRYRLVTQAENSGVSSARNRGVSLSEGDYIAFLDADDFWHPKKLQCMRDLILDNPSGVLYYHSWDVNGEHLDSLSSCSGGGESLSFLKLLIRNPIQPSCAVVANSRRVRFTSSMRYSEDYDLWLRLAYSGSVYHLDQGLTGLSRSVDGHRGLSAKRVNMRIGEMQAYVRLVSLNKLFALLVVPLIGWSFLKHVKMTVNRYIGK